ncbi:MAG: hypothetical protein M0Z67_02035 [Nitrospiraceae bacterium]|nr:hypothetical protein [Nitrospiraceae bacterium]
MKRSLVFFFCLSLLIITKAQAAFVSGSTGADGAFSPTANISAQIPESGILNYTTVNIPSGVTVTFRKNTANTPVYILATGAVTIAGIINVNGQPSVYTVPTNTTPGTSGPGGYSGGYGGAISQPGGKGLGPGGGGAGPSEYNGSCGGGFGSAGGTSGSSYCSGGPAYGNARLIPLIGGSGGGGAGGTSSSASYGGGGGGGAILIASSTTINITGSILANGGDGFAGGGGASGGAIRLIANTISGNGIISAKGGNLGNSNAGGKGRIRLEAFTNNFTPGTDPQYTYGQPGVVFASNIPSLVITSIGGVNVPATPTGSYSQPDILLPNTTTNPVSVAVAASNIPVGTTVAITVTPQLGTATSVNTTLSGTSASSTGSANITLSTYSNVITAQATYTLLASLYYENEKVDRVRVATRMGGESEVVYITESGREIRAELIAGLNQ